MSSLSIIDLNSLGASPVVVSETLDLINRSSGLKQQNNNNNSNNNLNDRALILDDDMDSNEDKLNINYNYLKNNNDVVSKSTLPDPGIVMDSDTPESCANKFLDMLGVTNKSPYLKVILNDRTVIIGGLPDMDNDDLFKNILGNGTAAKVAGFRAKGNAFFIVRFKEIDTLNKWMNDWNRTNVIVEYMRHNGGKEKAFICIYYFYPICVTNKGGLVYGSVAELSDNLMGFGFETGNSNISNVGAQNTRAETPNVSSRFRPVNNNTDINDVFAKLISNWNEFKSLVNTGNLQERRNKFKHVELLQTEIYKLAASVNLAQYCQKCDQPL